MRARVGWIGILALGVLTIVGAVPGSASGQPQTRKQTPVRKPPGEPKWTFEIHGGGALGTSSSTGSAVSQFPVGATFATIADPARDSRANPSWFYGDGAALFNQVAAQFASSFGQTIPQITPLDRVLLSQPTRRGSGASFGVRLGRRLTSRLALEFGVSRQSRPWRLTDDARDAIEDSRSSFEAAFSGLLQTIPALGQEVTSTATVPDDVNLQETSVTGALRIALAPQGRSGGYLTAGIGMTSTSGEELEVSLHGNYRFRLLDTFPFSETDLVTVTMRERDSGIAAVAGAGYTYHFRARQALQFDVRAHLTQAGVRTTVRPAPSIQRTNPVSALPSLTSPSIQFSTVSGIRSSLDGTQPELETFTGSGANVSLLVTAGYVFRF